LSLVGEGSHRLVWRVPLGLAVGIGLFGLQLVAASPADPARDIVRFRLFVSTTAASVEIGLENATIANQAVSFASGARRVFAATVSPGYDDTHLGDSSSHRVTDRAGGAYYEAQWTAALDGVPDWILITSWNEWYENTGIEPSVLYGDSYLRRARFSTYLFHSLAKPVRSSRDKPAVGKARPR
jgi:hypothetical protein